MAAQSKLVPQSVVVLKTQVFKVNEDWPAVIYAILRGRHTGKLELHCINGAVKAIHVEARESTT